jgi:hypothetical protein
MEKQEEGEEKRNFLFFLSSFFKHVRRKNLFPPTRDFRAPISLQRVTVDGDGA